MPEKNLISWVTIFLRAAVVSTAAAVAGFFVPLPPLSFLATLFAAGFLAGAWGRRRGWFSGLVVGFPFAFLQVTRWAGAEAGSPDYWRLAAPAALVAAGMAVLGGMSGAWLRDMKLQRESA